MRKFVLAAFAAAGLLLACPVGAQQASNPMYPDASNAKLSAARLNLGGGRPVSIIDHGAKADAKTWPDGVIAAGGTTFTSARANFTQGDVGKLIQIDGAAGIWLPPLRTTIQAVTDAHTVTLAAPATKATPRRWLSAAFVWTQRTAGNYVPGDLMTVQGGTFATAAVLRVVSTQVTATSIVNGGSGVNGACRVQGTTGNGTMFQQDVTISGGTITAVGSLYVSGHYFAKPTNLAVEPVTNAPGYNCIAPGATLALTMGVEQVVPQVKGDYDPVAIPADPFTTTAGSISGATGATFTTGGIPWGTFSPTGMFVYGHDDSQALKDSIDAAATVRFTEGKPSYVFMPAGNYLIDQISTPLMQTGLGIIGEGSNKTNIIVGANYVGDLFRWSEAWGAGGLSFGTGIVGTMQPIDTYTGPKLVGMSITGTLTAATRQNAIMFYDRVDNVFIDDVDVAYLTGRCMASGIRSIPDYPASMRESIIGRMRCSAIGGPGIPAIEFSTEGNGDAVDEININDINIYANYGDGFVIRNNSTNGNPARNFRINKLRIEGAQWADPGADLLVLGDPGYNGPITGVYINQLVLTTQYPNKAAFRITGPADIYFIQVGSGQITSGLPMGYGLVFDAGRNISIKMANIYSWQTNVTLGGSNAGLFLDLDGGEQWLTYNLANPQQLSSPVRRTGLPFAQADRNLNPTLTALYPDNSVRAGDGRAAGAVDWQMVRDRADLVARGQSSVIGGGDSNSIGDGGFQGVVGGGTWNSINGPGGTISGGSHNAVTGFVTTIPGGMFTTDRGATGGMYIGSPGCQPYQLAGSCQRSWHTFGAFPNTAAAVRLTSDMAAPAATGANCLPIPGGTSYQIVVRATARSWEGNEHATWDAKQGMLVHKGGFPTQYIGDAGGAQSQSTAGPFGTLGIAADATNNCLALTYTPPAGNTNNIHIVATVDAVEVQ